MSSHGVNPHECVCACNGAPLNPRGCTTRSALCHCIPKVQFSGWLDKDEMGQAETGDWTRCIRGFDASQKANHNTDTTWCYHTTVDRKAMQSKHIICQVFDPAWLYRYQGTLKCLQSSFYSFDQYDGWNAPPCTTHCKRPKNTVGSPEAERKGKVEF